MMKRHRYLLFIAIFGAVLLSACQDEGLISGSLILSGEHRLASGESLPGVLVILDGQLFIEENARVRGPVYMAGGSLESRGEISEDISVLGGNLVLGPDARVGGSLNMGGGYVERHPSAVVIGEVVTGTGLQVPDRPALFRETLRDQLIPLLVQSVLLGVLAYFTVRLLPNPALVVSKAIVEHPLVSMAVGILVGITGLVLLVLMAFTIVLIPVSFLFGFLILVAIIYGWIGYGSALGRLMLKVFNWRLTRPFAAAVGTILFVLLWNLLALIPIFQRIIPVMLAAAGLGAVFITRFGFIEFVPASDLQEPEF
jgi:hypothetical protein